MGIGMPRALIILTCSLSLFFSCSGPRQYSQVNFCWSTEYIIKPDNRFLTLDAKYDDVINPANKYIQVSSNMI
jgi:hypothetical protein